MFPPDVADIVFEEAGCGWASLHTEFQFCRGHRSVVTSTQGLQHLSTMHMINSRNDLAIGREDADTMYRSSFEAGCCHSKMALSTDHCYQDKAVMSRPGICTLCHTHFPSCARTAIAIHYQKKARVAFYALLCHFLPFITLVIACLITLPAASVSFLDNPVVTHTFSAG